MLAGCGPLFGGWSAYPARGVVVTHQYDAVAVARPPVPVTPAGTIGPLRVGLSTPHDVIDFLGRPKAMDTDSATAGRGFEALGYGSCKHSWATRDGTPACTTVFYFPSHTGTLAEMWTTSRRYAFRGIHVGVPGRSARLAFGKAPGTGCLTTWGFTSKSALVVVGIAGRGAGHVGYLVVHAEPLTKSNSLGALDCIAG